MHPQSIYLVLRTSRHPLHQPVQTHAAVNTLIRKLKVMSDKIVCLIYHFTTSALGALQITSYFLTLIHFYFE